MQTEDSTKSREWTTADGWNKPDASITTDQLDQAVFLVKTAREKYEAASKEKAFFNDELEKAENSLIHLLKKAGKTKYIHEELGTVSILNKFSYKVPKGLEEKRAFFDWIERTHGKEALEGMLSIHSATLNSFANEEKSKDALLQIPGLDAPTASESVRFTPKK